MATTTNYGWDTPDDTDLVKDGAAAIRTLGNSIDTTTKNLNPETTLGDIAYRSATANTNTRLPIGSNGQILGVSAGVPAWINNDQGDITEVQAGVGISIASGTGPIPVITNSSTDLITTAGDILYGTAADTVARLGIGTAGQVLTVNSGATAPQWATAAASSGPAFSVYRNQSQTLTINTWNKVQFEVEDFDTDSCYNNATNYRFTPNKSGYYQFNYNAQAESGYATFCALYKNGSLYHYGFKSNPGSSQNNHGNGAFIAYANGTTDYFEVYLNPGSGYAGTAVVNWGTDRRSAFSGVWIRS